MSLIRKPSELQLPSTIKMMVYGQAGSGKTTLALSAPSPLLLDFDNGVSRVNIAHVGDTLQVTSWAEIHNLFDHPQELAPYQSLVIDTVGKMMDFIIAGVCGAKQPSIKDWGKINAEFQWFTRAASGLGKNLIFVAHRDVRKEGEITTYIPTLRDKNYSAIVTDLDLLGYLEMQNDKGQQVQEIDEDVETITDADSANDFVERIKEYAHVGSSLAHAKVKFSAKVKQLGLELDKTSKKYYKPQTDDVPAA